MADVRVTIYGKGQLGGAVAHLLSARPGVSVSGPFPRSERHQALASGAELAIITTTTRLSDVADDIATAVRAGSNVITSAEEAADPFSINDDVAATIDALARSAGVTVVGAGVNPGLLFDALVLTMLGPAPAGCAIRVHRTVDISGFGPTVLRRIGVGLSLEEFEAGVINRVVLGHAGFPQSMAVVAKAQGLHIERIERVLRPVVTEREIQLSSGVVAAGASAGVDQRYTAVVEGVPWYTAEFYGHVELAQLNLEPADDIELWLNDSRVQHSSIRPGINAQVGSANMIANSVERVVQAPPGWLTVAELPPAYPRKKGMIVTPGGTRHGLRPRLSV